MSREASQILGSLTDLRWTVVRFHSSPRGRLIVTAVKNGLVAALELELPLPSSDEGRRDWIANLEALLADSAYDPTDAVPPVLIVALPGDLAELVPYATAQVFGLFRA